jgi:pimeloyl-ACP methyl ester carboxylesterase
VFLHEAQLLAESSTPSPTHPSVLTDIQAPVLLLHGSRSTAWFADSVRHVADHVPSPEIREIAGAGHFGPITERDAVASQMAHFFDEVLGAR